MVDPLLGGDDALRELLDEAHARDMRVVLDGVFNHCGRGWWPFHHVAENGISSPYRDWFILADDVRDGSRGISPYPTPGQMAEITELRAAGTAYGAASRAVLGYEAWWDLPALPKLNLDEPHLRALMLDVSERWIRFGIDGWRLDVAEEVGADFWREFRQRVRAADPEAYVVAEIWHHKPEWLQGDMFDAFMNYPLALGLMGFAAQDHLDIGIHVPSEYEGQLRAFDAAALWARIEEITIDERSRGDSGPVEPAWEPRHAASPDHHGWRSGLAAVGHAAADDVAGRAVCLLRGRDRHGRRHGSDVPACVSRGSALCGNASRTPGWPTPSRCDTPAPPFAMRS